MPLLNTCAIYGSPLYVYDLDEAERQAKALYQLLPKGAQVLYSVKANPIPPTPQQQQQQAPPQPQ